MPVAQAVCLMIGLVSSSLAAGDSPSHLADRPRVVTFEERVAAQRAIEEVYWRHRTWPVENPHPKPTLEEAMPESVLRAKVEDYLKRSNSLDLYWGRPISVQQLRAEVERMARDTHRPAVLREVFQALGNDPRLIAECVARPLLAHREQTRWYARDPRFHREARRRAEAAAAQDGPLMSSSAMDGEFQEIEWRLSGFAGDARIKRDAESTHIELDSDEWNSLTARLGAVDRPQARRIHESSDAFWIVRVLSRTSNMVRASVVRWTKTPLETWWQHESSSISAMLDGPEGSYGAIPVVAASCSDDTWTPTSPGGSGPQGRGFHSAVWTGSEMIVWGGAAQDPYGYELNYFSDGGRYDPATDTWREITRSPGSPVDRSDHTAVWTGTEMIVWGGWNEFSVLGSGARYNPSTDTWTPVRESGAGVPSARYAHSAIWTGREMIVWGGAAPPYFDYAPLNDGGRYDPSSDTWTAVSASSAPEGRVEHSAVWTGSDMIVWGGRQGQNVRLATGGRYDPTSDSWSPMSTGANTPSGRSAQGAVWTGTEMIVWGGEPAYGNGAAQGGARYDPASNSWRGMAGSGGPIGTIVSSLWTGTQMLVWGLSSDSSPSVDQGGRYDPLNDSWTSIPPVPGVPQQWRGFTAIWTGTEAIRWGGVEQWWGYKSGDRFDPVSGTWVPMAEIDDLVEPRLDHTAVWTGSEMIVWGGETYIPRDIERRRLNSGGRYDPVTNDWRPTSRGANVPAARRGHTAIWTGSKMIVWGGGWLATGAQYDPVADTWVPTSTGADCPPARSDQSAVWTGEEMIVWGGTSLSGGSIASLNSGGRYDPSSDSWRPTSTGANTPVSRSKHSAVWTGQEMIVWGGDHVGSPPNLNNGSRYDPLSDAWTPMRTFVAALDGHVAVWTGSEMLVWGGFSRGGRYRPGTDTWTSMAPPFDLGNLAQPVGVWTGSEMIIWGGADLNWGPTIRGGRYNPSADSWRATSMEGAVPRARVSHTDVAADGEMIVWGGQAYNPNDNLYPILGTGARYCYAPCTTQTWYRDGDSDGYGDPAVTQSSCDSPVGFVNVSGDCNDADPHVQPGAAETCDGVDNNCDGQIDETFGTTTCGVGACQRTVASCTNGAPHVCQPGVPTNEVCNGIDDDCDGLVDFLEVLRRGRRVVLKVCESGAPMPFLQRRPS